jgi:hypothetical protein
MALSAVQAALARLFTEEAARQSFVSDPPAAGRALGLDETDAAMLARIAPQALRQFAGSLKAKRVLDARKTMPLTAQALGDAFAEHFRAAAAPLRQDAGAAEEAQALAARLAALTKTGAIAPLWIGDLARYEAAFVAAARRRWGLRLLLFRYPAAGIAASLHAGAALGRLAARPSLGVWARRPGGRLFHRFWPSARRERQADGPAS